MNFLSKIPGPFLVFLGACALSFGGLIVKSFDGSTLWQILFWRSLFFIGVIQGPRRTDRCAVDRRYKGRLWMDGGCL